MSKRLSPPPGPLMPGADRGSSAESTNLGYHHGPPHSIDTEQAVLGAILTDPEAFSRVGWLHPEDFFRYDHRLIFQAIQDLAERAPPDLVTVGDQLGDQLEEAGGTGYLAYMVNTTPTSANVEHYAQVVRDRARQRQVMDIAEDLRAQAAGADPAELPGLIGQARTTLEGLESAASPALTDSGSIGVADLLAKKPPERRFLLQDLLPLGVVGLLAAGGGTGKSFLTIQLAIAVTTGRPFLGLEVGEPGGALILAAEDEREELHRRLWRVAEAMKADGDLEEPDLELIKERLFIASRVGEDNRLVQNLGGRIIPTGNGQKIAALVEELPPINLLVLDPVSRFRDGDENDNSAATRFVEVVETLRADTGATILLPHHVSKNGLQAGSESLTVEALRGASALVDGVRWAAAMATLRKDAAKDYGVAPEEADQFVRLETVKNNYAPPWEGRWLARGPGGVLAPTTLEKPQGGHQEQKAEARYQAVLPKLQGLIRQHQDQGAPLTKNRLRDYAGKEGMFGMGDQSLRGVLNRAIAEGAIQEVPVAGERKVLQV